MADDVTEFIALERAIAPFAEGFSVRSSNDGVLSGVFLHRNAGDQEIGVFAGLLLDEGAYPHLFGAEAPEAATTLLGGAELLIPLAGLIDREAESARLARDVDRHEKELARCEGKLANPNFVERAPPEVVATERARAAEHREALAKLREQLEALAGV